MSQEKVTYIIDGKNLLSKTLQKINADADTTERKLSDIGKGGIGGGGGGGGLLKNIVGGNLISNAITSATGSLKDFAKESFFAFGKFEQFGVALTTMFHGNKTQADQLSNSLVKFAKSTPFELTEIQDATKQLIAYGSTAGGVEKELRMLGDISSGVGAPLSEIAYLYGTARTQGRLFSRDIYQLSGRGIPIVQALAKQFKVADSQVMKLAEDGKIGFTQMKKALESMASAGGQFSGMMDAQSKTMLGAYSNLQDGISQLQVNLGKSQEGILKSSIKWVTDLVSGMNTALVRQNKIDEVLSQKNEQNGTSVGEGRRNSASQFLWGKTGEDVLNKKLNKFQDDIDLYVKDLSTLDQAQTAFHFLEKQKSSLNMASKLGADKDLITAEKYLLDQAFSDIKNFRDTFWQNKIDDYKAAKKEGEGSPMEKEKGLNTGTTIEAQVPRNMYINITKLVEKLEVHQNGLPESASKIREEVSKALLEVLNDAHLAQR